MSLFGLDYDLQLLENILNQLDITLSSLRDAIRGTGNKTLTDLDSDLSTIDSRLYNATDALSVYDHAKAIRGQTDKLQFDASSYLYVNAAVVSNPPNLDMALSSIFDVVASKFGEAYLYNATDALSVYDQVKSMNAKFPSAAALGDTLGNPTTTMVGSALLGWDGTYWRRLAADTSSRLRTVVEGLPSIPAGSNVIGGVFADYASTASINGTVGTTEVVGTSVDVRRGGRKVVYIDNSQDVDVTVTIEGSYDGVDWYTIRDGITVAAGTRKIGILRDAHGYVRARAVASIAPTTGSVLVQVSRMT